jgi:drug/metabolite transporter (DMT)-like permease
MPWIALLIGNCLHAVITSLLGLSMITPSDSLAILAIAAGACTVLGGAAAGRRPHQPGQQRLPDPGALAWLNLWTAVTFVAFFLGVAVYGAVVVFTLGASFAPLAVTVWSSRQAGNPALGRPSRAQWCAVGLMAVLGASLVVALAGTDPRGIGALLVASVLGVIDGIAAGGVAIVSRSMGRDGVGVWQVMAHRYYATVAVAVVGLLILVPTGLMAAPSMSLSMSIAAAFGSLVVPFFLIQYAVQRLAPVLVTAALALIPAIALFVEMAAGRAVSWPALALGLLIVPASLAIFAAEHKRPSAVEPEVELAQRVA